MMYGILQTAIAQDYHLFAYDRGTHGIVNAECLEQVERPLPWNLTAKEIRDIYASCPAP